jgi:hypothetical protein
VRRLPPPHLEEEQGEEGGDAPVVVTATNISAAIRDLRAVRATVDRVVTTVVDQVENGDGEQEQQQVQEEEEAEVVVD